jgi:hypothetical protein
VHEWLRTEAIHASLNIHYNLGEVHYHLSNIPTAKDNFEQAYDFITPGTPTLYRELLEAGLGLCALFDGRLTEANNREQNIHANRNAWHFNPFLLITFKTKMLLRRRQHHEAITLLEEQAKTLSYRYPVAALQLKIRLLRLLLKFDSKLSRRKELQQQISKTAEERQLPKVIEQMNALAIDD